MILTTLFDHQRALDAHILETHPELQGVDLLPRKILALQTALGKVSENWRGFMYWSNNQEPRKVEVSCMDDAAERLWCGTCHIDFPPDGEYERHEDLIGRLHSICPECKNNILMGFRTQIPLLEEYVDCLHFGLSIGLQDNHHESFMRDFREDSLTRYLNSQRTAEKNDIVRKFTHLMGAATEYVSYRTQDNYYTLMAGLLRLGEMLGFTWEQIEQAYLAKNAENHHRQEAGY